MGGARESNCVDGADNDGDGATDCDDSDCASNPVCTATGEPEICGDGFDNDGDGTFDCGDSDCFDDDECADVGNCSDEDIADLSSVDYADLIFTCGLDCLGGGSRECAGSCVSERTGISRSCGDCFGGLIECAQDLCLGSCLVDPAGGACISCVTDGCGDDFFFCSGFELEF